MSFSFRSSRTPRVAEQVLGAERRFPLCRPEPLEQLFRRAGLISVSVCAIDVPAAVCDFEDYWRPFLGQQGAAPTYLAALPVEPRERIREALKARLVATADGSIAMTARAWAVQGTVPPDRSLRGTRAVGLRPTARAGGLQSAESGHRALARCRPADSTKLCESVRGRPSRPLRRLRSLAPPPGAGRLGVAAASVDLGRDGNTLSRGVRQGRYPWSARGILSRHPFDRGGRRSIWGRFDRPQCSGSKRLHEAGDRVGWLFRRSPRVCAAWVTVAVLGEYSATCKATGKSFKAPFAHAWKLQDGKARSFQQYTDTAVHLRPMRA